MSTRGQVLDRVLETIAGGDNYRARATIWLNDALKNWEIAADWGMLYVEGVLTLDAGVSKILFSASKWGASGSSALTDYSKDMNLFSSNGRPLKRFKDIPGMTAEGAYQEAVGLGQSAADPTHFLCIDNSRTPCVKVVPTPSTAPDALSYSYRATMVLPTEDSDDLLTKSYLPVKYQAFLDDYILSRLYETLGFNDKSLEHLTLWEQNKKTAIVEEFPNLVKGA